MSDPMTTDPRIQAYDDLDFDQDEVDATGDEEWFDCHMRPDGQCGAAGSEMCDFECPTMAAMRRQWRREDAKHGKR